MMYWNETAERYWAGRAGYPGGKLGFHSYAGGFKFFFGAVSSSKLRAEVAQRRPVGQVIQRGELYRRKGTAELTWAYDNGAFRDHLAGTAFDEAAFEADLEQLVELGVRHLPMFATLPDVVGGGLESLALSESWAKRVPRSNKAGTILRWYLVVQDGMEDHVDQVRRVLIANALDGIFIGGSDQFKRTACTWTRLAHDMGIHCHFGRASSLKSIAWARMAECDSADSSLFQRSSKKTRSILRFIDSGFKAEYLHDLLWPQGRDNRAQKLLTRPAAQEVAA